MEGDERRICLALLSTFNIPCGHPPSNPRLQTLTPTASYRILSGSGAPSVERDERRLCLALLSSFNMPRGYEARNAHTSPCQSVPLRF